MTVTHRKRQYQPEEIQTVNEPGLQIQCDGCLCDLTHSIRIKCADSACEPGDGVDICPTCFCNGKEFAKHKRWHAYRVVELHSYPIFTEDWGADEELLLLEGISLQGLGNWQAIAEHVGTRTKEEVEEHYKIVYIDSSDWPLPRMDQHFNIDPAEFQEHKRRRISTMNTNPPPAPKTAPTSAPNVHEVATFLPGRLEFEHELDNEAEDLVKDLEFGICLEWEGDQILEDENDPDVRARARWEEEQKSKTSISGKHLPNGLLNGLINGHHSNGDTPTRDLRSKSEDARPQNGGADEETDVEELTQPPPIETSESLAFKLSFIEMYNQRVEKRHENKGIMFNRGLLNYRQMQAAEKKRPKEEKDIIHRLRPFARLQTAEDFEVFCADILYESLLRKRIQELQHYRRMGLTTAADIDKYEADVAKRSQVKANLTRDYYSSERFQLRAGSGRQSSADPRTERGKSHEREMTPKAGSTTPNISGTGPPGRKMPAPLNLANSPSLHLLTPEEQTLCSQLRILPKPYLVIKETLVREYARRGGKLRRREARDLVKIDVNKTSRVWDFLVQAGFLKVGAAEPPPTLPDRPSATPTLSASPSKDSQLRVSPRPPPFTTAPLAMPHAPFPSASSSSVPHVSG
ncbi:uncharacterized protein FIBRA_01672 [Fibroporia radiculosa]|uniref:Transcriptional adapter 2 n=1 Tax=Fibroporia radiculosa TaxID=599839 RepID=J4HTQ0_9APHY|nr:uncharacterized protein FIBRA_01672 [Fibroporia radiculosa]CCL99652.1 predicted protein [Fibroporia radiculosa]